MQMKKHRTKEGLRNKETDLVEIIKYGSKIFTDPDGKKRRDKRGSVKIYVRALDNIYAAMKGEHLTDRFGFNLPKKAKKEKSKEILTSDYIRWEYDLKSRDWLSEDYESTLTAFVPDAGLESILENYIDTSLD